MIDVMAELRDIGRLYKQGALQSGLLKLQELWDSIQEPKTNVANSYLVIEYAVKFSMELGNLDKAWEWAKLAPIYNKNRQDIGEAEFLVGKVAYEKGDINEAKNQFHIANEKSQGKIFHGEDLKYKKLLK